MITAEEFLNQKLGKTPIGILPEVLIEFAKLHVEAALKEASEKATAFSKTSVYGGQAFKKKAIVNSYSILNAYSLENIK
jgi:hypothetical protein